MAEYKYTLKDLMPPLTDKQYLSARNGGYTAQELEDADYYWYQDRRSLIVTNKLTDPATQKQLAFILEHIGVDGSGDFTYQRARKIIQQIEFAENADERYITLLTANRQKATEKKRKQRATTKIGETEEFTEEFTEEIVEEQIIEPIIEEEEYEENSTLKAFIQTKKETQ